MLTDLPVTLILPSGAAEGFVDVAGPAVVGGEGQGPVFVALVLNLEILQPSGAAELGVAALVIVGLLAAGAVCVIAGRTSDRVSTRRG